MAPRPKFAVITIGENPLTVVQSKSLSFQEEDFLANYALPSGSKWYAYPGARSFKIFPVYPEIVCVSYTVIDLSGSLCCLAGLFKNETIDRMLRQTSEWADRLFSPLINQVEDAELKQLLQSGLQNRPEAEKVSLNPIDWLCAQLHLPVLHPGKYKSPKSWRSDEEYLRRVFLATYWQRQTVRFFCRNSRIPSMTTLTSSRSEFTRINGLPA